MMNPRLASALLLLSMAALLTVLVGVVEVGGRGVSRDRKLPPPAEFFGYREDVLRAPEIPAAAPDPSSSVHAQPAEAAPAPRVELGRLTGLVLRQDGEPAADARVVLGEQQARCDGEGRFVLALVADPGRADLVAYAPGHELALRPAFGSGLARGRDTDVRLVLGAPTLTIAGSVSDPDGRPLEGWTVELDGLDPLAHFGLREPVHTDAEGLFSLGDVPAGVHVLRAWKEQPAAAYRSGPVEAGAAGVSIVARE